MAEATCHNEQMSPEEVEKLEQEMHKLNDRCHFLLSREKDLVLMMESLSLETQRSRKQRAFYDEVIAKLKRSLIEAHVLQDKHKQAKRMLKSPKLAALKEFLKLTRKEEVLPIDVEERLTKEIEELKEAKAALLKNKPDSKEFREYKQELKFYETKIAELKNKIELIEAEENMEDNEETLEESIVGLLLTKKKIRKATEEKLKLQKEFEKVCILKENADLRTLVRTGKFPVKAMSQFQRMKLKSIMAHNTEIEKSMTAGYTGEKNPSTSSSEDQNRKIVPLELKQAHSEKETKAVEEKGEASKFLPEDRNQHNVPPKPKQVHPKEETVKVIETSSYNVTEAIKEKRKAISFLSRDQNRHVVPPTPKEVVYLKKETKGAEAKVELQNVIHKSSKSNISTSFLPSRKIRKKSSDDSPAQKAYDFFKDMINTTREEEPIQLSKSSLAFRKRSIESVALLTKKKVVRFDDNPQIKTFIDETPQEPETIGVQDAPNESSDSLHMDELLADFIENDSMEDIENPEKNVVELTNVRASSGLNDSFLDKANDKDSLGDNEGDKLTPEMAVEGAEDSSFFL